MPLPSGPTEPAPSGAFDLTGRRALVTGASRGIGPAIAVGPAAHGADVVAVARSPEGLAATVAGARGHRGIVRAQASDLSQPESIERCVEAAAETLGGMDILVNNAGTFHAAHVEHTDPLRVGARGGSQPSVVLAPRPRGFAAPSCRRRGKADQRCLDPQVHRVAWRECQCGREARFDRADQGTCAGVGAARHSGQCLGSGIRRGRDDARDARGRRLGALGKAEHPDGRWAYPTRWSGPPSFLPRGRRRLSPAKCSW